MSDIQSIVNSLLARAQVDPVLLSALQEMLNELDRLGIVIDPPPITPSKISGVGLPAPAVITDFTARTTSRNVVLEWLPVGADFVYYEIRKGLNWNTADRITITTERRAILDPILVGTHTYLLKTLSINNVYSNDTASVSIIIPPIGTFTIAPQTIDQNVLLYWSAPTSTFDIDHYTITKGGVEVGRVSATFVAQVELVGNLYRYGITAVDIAGNTSPTSFVEVSVSGPKDFVLQSQFDANLNGTKVNAFKIVSKNVLLLPVKLTETWRQHAVNNSWTKPSQQVAADYPYYAEPGNVTASYKETFDMGAIYPASIISTSWNANILDGSFNIGVSTRVSDDNISWSSAQVGVNIFVESVRYIETTMTFTGADARSLMDFFNLHVAVSVKETMDSGEIDCIASDVNGTVVAFNIPFRDVNSITLSTKTTTEQFTTVYRFTDVPNPVSFSIFVYDSSGIRVAKRVTWKARGII